LGTLGNLHQEVIPCENTNVEWEGCL
jgi:hypothetical protein